MEGSHSSTALSMMQTPPPHFHSPAIGGGGDHSSGRFMLPAGWGIEEVPRSDGSHVDRYYFEPGTGKKFRSLREVERHLNGEEYTSRCRAFTNPLTRKMVVSGGKVVSVDEGDLNMKNWAIVCSTANTATSRNQLPNGWIVEEVPRRDGSAVDKYYYEPGTGKKFRSKLAIKRHLAEFGDHMPLSQAQEILNQNRLFSKSFKHANNSASSKTNILSGDVKKASSFVGPPSKIKWVLASPIGNSWNPFLAETPIPDSVKHQWITRFTLFMNNKAASNSV